MHHDYISHREKGCPRHHTHAQCHHLTNPQNISPVNLGDLKKKTKTKQNLACMQISLQIIMSIT